MVRPYPAATTAAGAVHYTGAMTDQLRSVRDGGVATLTLNRPEALNAITPTMLTALGDELESLAGDESVRVIVLTGEGRAFSAGVDLKALGEAKPADGEVGGGLNTPARRGHPSSLHDAGDHDREGQRLLLHRCAGTRDRL